MSIELQNLDCNCNNCKFMDRDMVEFNLWRGYAEHLQYIQFLRNRRTLFLQASGALENGSMQGYELLLAKGRKMKFQFDKAQLTLGYGFCLNRKGKFSQPVTFIPNTYQADTQHCFVNRK